VAIDPTSPSSDASGEQALDELPEPRVAGPLVRGVRPEQAEGLASLAEFKPSKSVQARVGEVGGDLEDADVEEAEPVTRVSKKKGSAFWYALVHLNNAHERRRLLHLMKRKRALLASGALVFIGVVSLAAAVGFSLARSAPSWWVDIDKQSPRNIELAELVQNGALSHLFEDRKVLIGGAVEWPVKMTDEAANAWMNIKLPEWFANISDGMEWPETVTQIQIVFDSGTINMGIRVLTDGGSRIYSCAIVPELRDDGSLWMKARTVSMGRLTVPAGWVLRGAESSADGFIPEQLRGTAEAEALFEKLTGKLPLFDVAEVSLGDGRIVRLLGLRVRDGTVIAHCVTRNPE